MAIDSDLLREGDIVALHFRVVQSETENVLETIVLQGPGGSELIVNRDSIQAIVKRDIRIGDKVRVETSGSYKPCFVKAIDGIEAWIVDTAGVRQTVFLSELRVARRVEDMAPETRSPPVL